MGLDNIPHVYPCKKNNTAVMAPVLNDKGEKVIDENGETVTGIDCRGTQKSGGCPYVNANPPAGGVTGIFGTDCWYRGKYGNYLVDLLGIYDETGGLSFYGSNYEGDYKTPSECLELAQAMEDEMKEIIWSDDPSSVDYLEEGHALSEEMKQHYEYAVWWLKWVANEADGTDCWY